MQAFVRRLARRWGAADSIATRIPPSPAVMIGWLEDCGTGGLEGLEKLEALRRKASLLRRKFRKSWGGPEELFGDLQSIPGVLTGFYAALMELVVVSWGFWMGSS